MVAPMTEPAFFVLTALVGKPRHGYGIVTEVADLSGGRVALRVGTLYGVLGRLGGGGAGAGGWPGGSAPSTASSTGGGARGWSSSIAKRCTRAGCAATTGSPETGASPS